jgi:sporulation-control protein
VGLRRMLQALGVAGPAVETVLDEPHCRPGGYLAGHVQVFGGERPVDIEYVALSLRTRIGAAADGGPVGADREFRRQRLTGSFRLDAGARHDVPFRLDVPWQTPITEVYGQHLHGMTMGLSTELEVAREVDKGDLDAVAVHPLPAQELILDGLLRLGFRFSRAEVVLGRLPDVTQDLPFHQEIEFAAPSAYAAALDTLAVAFLPTPEALQVVLGADLRGAQVVRRDTLGRFTAGYDRAAEADWPGRLDGWIREALHRRGAEV